MFKSNNKIKKICKYQFKKGLNQNFVRYFGKTKIRF